MLIFKAFHIIAMVAWFAGLFYLPRLFVYHSSAADKNSITLFKKMEGRLYYFIMWPAALLTTALGIILLSYNFTYYLKAGWLHLKISLVILLWIYHFSCGYYVKRFANDTNNKRTIFFRMYNEVPTFLLVSIVLLVVLKPF